VAGAFGQRGGAVDRGGDVGGLAEIALRDDLGAAADAGDLAQVVVGLPVDPLAHNARH
jgi:hypothetical protein